MKQILELIYFSSVSYVFIKRFKHKKNSSKSKMLNRFALSDQKFKWLLTILIEIMKGFHVTVVLRHFTTNYDIILFS